MQSQIVDDSHAGNSLGVHRPWDLLNTWQGHAENTDEDWHVAGGDSGEGSRAGLKRHASDDDDDLLRTTPKKRTIMNSASSESPSNGGVECLERNGCGTSSSSLGNCSSFDVIPSGSGCLLPCYVMGGFSFSFQTTDNRDTSDKESIYSIQSKVTELVKDSSDDLWFLEEDANRDRRISVDIFADEYEVFSERSFESYSDVEEDSFQQDMIVICEESDLEFFADCEWSNVDDSSDDEELSQADKWFCNICEHLNGPLHRFCESCWTLRPDWLPKPIVKKPVPTGTDSSGGLLLPSVGEASCKEDNQVDNGTGQAQLDNGVEKCEMLETHPLHTPHESHTSSAFDLMNRSVVEKEPGSSQESGFCSLTSCANPVQMEASVRSSVEDLSTSLSVELNATQSSRVPLSPSNSSWQNSQQSAQTTASACSPSSSCIICLSQPKEATIVHGNTGHQSCCYRCARRLKRCNRPCPVCRRDIQKVIRNYLV